MRPIRGLGLFAALGLVVVMALPATALATTSQTLHATPANFPIDLGPSPCMPGDVSIVSGNGVQHLTVNNAGDSWFTTTIEGWAADPDAGWSGHATAWFNINQNNQNGNSSFIVEATGALPDGTHVGIHANGTFAMNALGVITVNRSTLTCN